ncbi:hypothetical protein H072_5292 [Dactylellina haptotyla CBS 200.50]|uniref:DUF4215 domain-containing protein n=1 Tax=Dactylellina haptotyla (strain CBS 200.50) TaxID=1284197 RepID=S8AI93_DACHA|nr:hypothetical protein H072_5292 [Dactylellina haptotyla CBS 200.50]
MKFGSLFLLAGLCAAEDLLFHTYFTGWEDSVASSSSYNYTWTYKIVTDDEWQAMTTDDFKKYKAIVIGDPIETDPSYLDYIMPNRKTWANAVEGNVILIGTDTSNHYSNARDLMSNGIAFSATGKGTGLYFSLSKYYGGLNKTTVDILDIFGKFEVRGDLNTESSDQCYDEVHIVARNQVLDGITDMSLSNWSCSVHEAFVTYPSTGDQSFVPLAIAQGVPGDGSRDFSDGTSGIPYVIVRGAVSPIGCGNGRLDPGEECDDGNTQDGDGCNSACRLESKKKSAAGPVVGGTIAAVAGVVALGTLGFLAITKTAAGAKAAAAVGISTSGAAGGGGGGSGAAGASGAMYVPTGIEGKAAAAATGYVPTGLEGKAAAQATYIPGVTEKAASSVAHSAGQAAHGAAQATQGISSAAVPPPTDAGTSAAFSSAIPPADPTAAATAASAGAAPPAPPPITYIPGTEGALASAPAATAGGINAAGAGVSSAGAIGSGAAGAGVGGVGSMAPGVAGVGASGAGMAPGIASAGAGAIPAAAGGGLGSGAAAAGAGGGLGTGAAAAGTGGGLSVGQTISTSIAAGFAGIGGALFGRKKKKQQQADAEAMPFPPMAPDQQAQYYAPEQQQYYNQSQPQPYYSQDPIYSPQQPTIRAVDEKEVEFKTGEGSNAANLNVGVQEVVPTPQYEIQGDPISHAEMPVVEQPYIPPPPGAVRKEYK